MEQDVKETKDNGKFIMGVTPGPGRPKGVPNKTTRLAKSVIAEAADRLGGPDRLVEWAKESPGNERIFWGTIYPKLLPLQVNAEIEGRMAVRGALVWKAPK